MKPTNLLDCTGGNVFSINPSQRVLLGILAAAIVMDVVLWWPRPPETERKLQSDITQFGQGPNMGITQPLPWNLKFDSRKVALGRSLFEDARLSADDSVSCASCHSLTAAGVDGRQRSIGIHGAEGGINAPTVFNSGFNFVQFWDGRAATLEEQVDGPVNHPKEMGSNWTQVISKISQDPHYRSRFETIYPDGITVSNIKNAIATFERSLVTPNSRFDQFLRGDTQVLSEFEVRGWQLFQDYGCSSCHQGVNLGGNMYERMGLMGDYFGDRGNPTPADEGRFNVTGREADRHYFRVPSLRNVARTAPYFHDGSVENLAEAVRVMAKYQLGRPMPEEDLRDIVAFLLSLTGEYEGQGL